MVATADYREATRPKKTPLPLRRRRCFRRRQASFVDGAALLLDVPILAQLAFLLVEASDDTAFDARLQIHRGCNDEGHCELAAVRQQSQQGVRTQEVMVPPCSSL